MTDEPTGLTSLDLQDNAHGDGFDASGVQRLAHQLALRFSEPADIPSRLRATASAHQTAKRTPRDSAIEQRFADNVAAWRDVAERMLSELESDLAWRLLSCDPLLESQTESVTQNDDFRRFLDYLILRRDISQCSPTELGRLCILMSSVQRQIEARIQQ